MFKQRPDGALLFVQYFFGMLVGDQQQEPDGYDRLTDLHPGCLPGTEERDTRPQLGTETEYVCHAAEDGDQVPGCDHAEADVSRDGAAAISPKCHQTNVPADANGGQAHQEYRYLHEPNHRTAVHVEDGRPGAHQKNQKADQCDEQPGTNAEAGRDGSQGYCFGGDGGFCIFVHYGKYVRR